MTDAVPQHQVGPTAELVEVRLLGLPVPVHQQASEHFDELQREFALLRVQQDDVETPDVPARLLDLVDALRERFSGFTTSTIGELEQAMDEGRERVDLVFRVPPEASGAARQLGELLDEADRYCRRGGALLTLEAPPAALAYRRWYLDEFVHQIDGGAPRPWTGA
jgi:hypothetical protein